MTIVQAAVLQTTTNTSSATSTAFANPITVGNLLVTLACSMNTLSTITDVKGNSWTAMPSPLPFNLTVDTSYNLYGWTAPIVTGGSGEMITLGTGGPEYQFTGIILEISGRNNSVPISITPVVYQNSSNVTSHAGTSIVVGSGNVGVDILSYNMCIDDGALTWTAGAGWTIPTNGSFSTSTGNYVPGMVQCIANASANTYTGSFTTNNSDVSAGYIVAINPSLSSGGSNLLTLGVR